MPLLQVGSVMGKLDIESKTCHKRQYILEMNYTDTCTKQTRNGYPEVIKVCKRCECYQLKCLS